MLTVPARYILRKIVNKRYSDEDTVDLLGRRWFTRLWTFQELILAQDLMFMCGDRSLHPDEFLSGISYMRDAIGNTPFMPTGLGSDVVTVAIDQTLLIGVTTALSSIGAPIRAR
jgi:hypothetical protein